MKMIRTITAMVLIAGTGLTPTMTQAEEHHLGGVQRFELQRQELSIPGRQAIQVLVEFGPGVSAPSHSHPGEEIVYVVDGLLEYVLEGRPPVTLKAGDVLFIPYGTFHSARNVGSGKAAELATYIVENGKPLVVLSD